jgi:hypothetical protein
MTRSRFCWILPGLALATSAAAATLQFEGRAHDLETGAWIYTERHIERFDGDQPSELITRYERPDGELIAERRIDFTPLGSTRPAFELRSLADGLLEGARHENGILRVYRRDRDGMPLREAQLAMDEVDVIDAGFTHFIRQNWDPLSAGARVEFDFLVPSRLSGVPMQLRRIPAPADLSEPALSFRLELRNPVLRLFVDPIEVSFRASDRSLLRYVGISNLPAGSGDNASVRIEFDTPATPARTQAAGRGMP